ncbi:hypothetical protein I552_7698 [Mycobacterium xenopi 3993]|nr:hypothetical protein I552_7698 [Mycobacterium xenopi 3993]
MRAVGLRRDCAQGSRRRGRGLTTLAGGDFGEARGCRWCLAAGSMTGPPRGRGRAQLTKSIVDQRKQSKRKEVR